MQTFLSKVLDQILKKEQDLSSYCFVLPNKRAGVFLRKELNDTLPVNSFFPKILSIDEFMQQVSGLEILDNVALLFEFYSVFKRINKTGDQDSFESFSKWAHILLQDFNELDGNLAEAESILKYIYEAKRIENWNVEGSDSSMLVSNYLSFHQKIPVYYGQLIERMTELSAGYQGWVYRKAFEAIERNEATLLTGSFVFVGFNALSKSEEGIIQKLLIDKRAEIFWDDDPFYQESKLSAGSFFEYYKTSWPYYRDHDFRWSNRQIQQPKTIFFHGLPKNISQIKHTGNLLRELSHSGTIKQTALILGNEKLLPSLLSSLPEEISEANITMGYDLQNVALSSFFEALFRLHLKRASRSRSNDFYYKDLQHLFTDPQIKPHCLGDGAFQKKWKRLLYDEKVLFFSEKELLGLPSNESNLNEVFSLLFSGYDQDINQILQKIILILDWFLRENKPDSIETEFLFQFHSIFSQLLTFNQSYGHLDSLSALYQFYKQLLQIEKLSFQGEPLSGLQIMGLLESRVLDFETVILTSVNEGFIPSAKTENSFIPFDIKIEKNLPTHKEKEAIFNYHFFRLLHRAKRVYLVYNTITDDFGAGEPSRFLKQLEVAKKLGLLENVEIKKIVFQPQLIQDPLELKSIVKTDSVFERMTTLSKTGYSPTSLTTYIRNPLDFYKRYILRIREYDTVEESIGSNTFGTIIHDTLEALYKPHVKKELTLEDLNNMKERLHAEVLNQFAKSYSVKAIRSGKNYLSFEIAKQFIENFLNLEKKEIEKGKKIKILALEEKFTCLHKSTYLDFPIQLKGTIDRIDEIDGNLRIVDYKTGKVSPSDMNIKDWDKLILDEKHSKAFQVLLYAYLFVRTNPELATEGVESGIISFKNLKSNFMKVNSSLVNQETLDQFISQLDLLLKELYDSEIPFVEKELPVYYR